MQRFVRRLSVLALMALTCTPVMALDPEVAQRHAAELDEAMNRLHQVRHFNGAVLVAEEGEVIYKKGFGLAHMGWEIANAPDTKFRIGSITKPFTAIMTLQLVEEGSLALDGHISDYLHDYPKPNGERITIRHLLSHRSGIPNYLRDIPEFRNRVAQSFEPEDFVELFAGLDLRFEPGSKFEYCNSGYYLLGVIIEKVTGKTFQENLNERILGRAGMSSTGFARAGEIVPRAASGYYRDVGGGLRNARFMDPSVFYAAGGMYSTVEDLYLWDKALYDDRLLSAESRELMFAPQHRSENGGYGLGWDVRRVPLEGVPEPVHLVGHLGDNPGFFAVVARALDSRDLFVFLVNTNAIGIHNVNEIIVPLMCIINDQPYPQPRRSAADALAAVLGDQGIEAAAESFRSWRSEHADDYDFGEGELNALGYQLLGSGQAREAVEVFKLNVETHPESANVYDSLGEGYMKLGDTTNAIRNYERSLELNPDNNNAREMLSRLRGK